MLPGSRPGGSGPMSGPGVGASGGMMPGPGSTPGTVGGSGGRKSGPGEGCGMPGVPGTFGPSMFGGGCPGMPGPGKPPGWPPGGSMPPGKPPGPMSNNVAAHAPILKLGVHTGGWSKNASLLPDRCTSGPSTLATRRPTVAAARTVVM